VGEEVEGQEALRHFFAHATRIAMASMTIMLPFLSRDGSDVRGSYPLRSISLVQGLRYGDRTATEHRVCAFASGH